MDEQVVEVRVVVPQQTFRRADGAGDRVGVRGGVTVVGDDHDRGLLELFTPGLGTQTLPAHPQLSRNKPSLSTQAVTCRCVPSRRDRHRGHLTLRTSVVDAFVRPDIPSANAIIPTTMIAQRVASSRRGEQNSDSSAGRDIDMTYLQAEPRIRVVDPGEGDR